MLITSTVIASVTIWAVAASIMAYNRGREVDEMVDRHHSVVRELRLTEIDFDNAKREHRSKERELERTYLAALDKVANLTEEVEQWKGMYTSNLNRADHYERLYTRMTTRNRDPKTGRIIAAKPQDDKALAAFDAMMGNAIDKLNGLRVRNLCDEVKANAVTGF